MGEQSALPPTPAREWFVSYDVTERRIVLQRSGEDPQEVATAEVYVLRDDLLAAAVAAHEHAVMRGEETPDA